MRILLALIMCVLPAIAQIQQHAITTNKIVISNGITNDANNLRINIYPGPGITLTTNNTRITFSAAGAGLGDVTGPAAAVDEDIAVFDGVSGKLIKDSGVLISDLALSGHTHVQLHNRGHSVVDVLDHTDWPATVSLTELGYIDGVVSSIQTQLDNRQATNATLTHLSTNTITGTGRIVLESLLPSGTGDDVWVNHANVSNPNLTNSATITWSVSGTNVSASLVSSYLTEASASALYQATNANLTLWSGLATSSKQDADADLTSISAIGGAVGQLIQHDGTRWTNTAANPFQATNANLTALSAYGPTTWQATNANLTSLSAYGPTTWQATNANLTALSAYGPTTWQATNANLTGWAALATSAKQDYDADLTALAGNDGSSLTNMLGATNAYQLVNYAQLQAAIPANRVAYFTSSFASGFTPTGTVGLTNYAGPDNPATAWTNSAATWAYGTYVAMFITTNTFTSFSSGLVNVEVYCFENSAGSGSITAEVYVMNSVSKIEEYEFTPAPAFQTVPATSTPTKLTFSVPITDYTSTTNLHLAVKIKVSESSTPDPTIRIVGGGVYSSHLEFAIPGSLYLTKSEATALYQPLDADLTSWAGVTRAAGFDTFTATPSSANLRGTVTDENGTGALLFDGASSLALGSSSFTAITNSALTAGRVIFSGTTKEQADDADLTFATDTLTATKVSAPTAVYASALTVTNTATLATVAGAVDAGGATSLEIPNSDDPDVDAAGEISWDTDGWLRAYDGSNQVAVGRKLYQIDATVYKPNDLDDAQRDGVWIWSNQSGMSFVVTGWSAQSSSDDTDLNIEEIDADGQNNTTVDAVSITTNGTGIYYASDTTITAATIETGHILVLDFDDTDTPSQVHITIYGYFDANVN